MATIRLYIGHNSRVGENSREKTLATLSRALQIADIDGATIYDAMGIYKGETEKTTVCVLSMLTPEQVEKVRYTVCFLLRVCLMQECVGFEVSTDEMEYI